MNVVNVLGKGELQDELKCPFISIRWRRCQWVIASDTPDVILIFQTMLNFERITHCHWLCTRN